MAKIELNKECPEVLHEFTPIIEGGQTVGITCIVCGKSVREDMAHSSISVNESEIINLQSIIPLPDVHRGNYRRKDPRF